MTMNELCFERALAPVPSSRFGAVPPFKAATMRRCAGRIRIQTFKAMIVPIIAPACRYAPRPLKYLHEKYAATTVKAYEMATPSSSTLQNFQVKSYNSQAAAIIPTLNQIAAVLLRSEEHTSELQSL